MAEIVRTTEPRPAGIQPELFDSISYRRPVTGVRPKPKLTVHGPRFFPLEDITATAQSLRLRSGYQYSTEHWTMGKKADRKARELIDLHGFVAASNSTITLDDFPLNSAEFPTKTEDHLSKANKIDRLLRSTFMPFGPYGTVDLFTPPEAEEFMKAIDEHGSMSQTDRGYFKLGGEGAPLMAAFNRRAYEYIREEYGLETVKEAEKFYAERTKEANQILRRIANEKLPGESDAVGLLNNTSLISSPGKLMYYALSEHVSPRLQFEALRTLTVAELLAKSEKHAEGLTPILDDFQDAIDNKIFNSEEKIGQTQKVAVYAIFDKETGRVRWNSRTDAPLTPEDYEEYQQTGILKRFDWNVRHVVGVGDVLTNPRTKGKASIFEKMIRDAEAREELIGDRYIEPAGVRDLGGFMHILLNEKELDGSKIEKLIAMHVDLAENTFDSVEIIPHDNTLKGVGQSEEHQFRRVDFIVSRNNRKYRVEIIFKPLPYHLTDEFKFGTISPVTGLPDGPAHGIYDAIRSTIAARRAFPEGVPEQELFGHHDWDEITYNDTNKVIERLLMQDTIDFSKLPIKYLDLAA